MLIGHWKLDGDAKDSSGNGYDGVEHGTLSYTKGIKGQCLSLDGTANTGIELLRHDDAKKYDGLFSISLWFTSETSSGHDNPRIISRDCSEYFCISVNQTASPNHFNNYRNTAFSTNINVGDWYHLVLTIDADNNISKSYINGSLDGTTTVSQTGTVRPIVLGGNTEGDGDISGDEWVGKIDDVRIYNHILSDKEVKELSKAKILHYKFDDFQEYTENLEPDPIDFSTGYDGGGSQWYTKSVVNFQGKKCLKYDIDCPGGQSSWEGSYIGIDTVDVGGINGDWFTRSAWVYVEKGGLYDPNHPEINATHSGWTNGENSHYDLNKVGTWQYLSASAQIGDDTGDTRIFLYLFFQSADDPADINFTVYFWHPQLEKKDHATPFVDGIREGKVNDCSGNGNNAILDVYSPEWTEESVIGKGAYYFNNPVDNNQTYYHFNTQNQVFIPEEGTIACWVKGDINNQNDNNIYPVGFHQHTLLGPTGGGSARSGLITKKDGSNYNYNWENQNIYDNNWHHYAVLWDLTNVYLYKDGNQVGSPKAHNNNIKTEVFADFIVGSAWATNYGGHTGYIDDVRVYATALSEDDIKQLYKNRGSIDNKGNLYSHGLIEYNNWHEDIKANSLVENGCQEYQNNYNFSSFEYDEDNDCISRTSGSSNIYSDNFIPVKAKEGDLYKLNGRFKNAGSERGRLYFGVVCYDKNKDRISPQMVNHYTDTETTLAQNLNDGDTTVYLTDATNWRDESPGEYEHWKRIAIWGDRSEYPDYTYTRVYDEYLDVDFNNNTLTLQDPWNKGNVSAGTAVAECYSGGTFSYIAASNVLVPNEWTKYEGNIGAGWTVNGSNSYFRYGTEYIKLLFLINRDTSSGTTTLVKDMKFWNDTKDQNPIFNENKKILPSSKGEIKFEKFNNVGPTEGLVGYWPLNGNTRDYSKNQNHGVNNGAIITSGLGQSAYEFDSQNAQYINLSHGLLDMSKFYSVSLWIYATENPSKSRPRCFSMNDGNGNGVQIWMADSNHYIGSNIKNGEGYISKKADSCSLNTWYHVVVNYNSLNSIENIYIDGIDKNISDLSLSGTPLSAIGAGLSTSNYTWEGKIQDVRLYDRVLTSEEIKILYYLTNPDSKQRMMQSESGILYIKGEVREC